VARDGPIKPSGWQIDEAIMGAKLAPSRTWHGYIFKENKPNYVVDTTDTNASIFGSVQNLSHF
jgi:hypothetical protein